MNIKDMIFPLVLAILSTWLIQYFFFSKKEAPQTYQFTAPQTAVECVPLYKNITFVDTKRPRTPTIESVETKWGHLEFSTEGAALTRLSFERTMNNTRQEIGTIFPPELEDKDNRAFIVGLNEESPYIYRLIDRRDEDDKIEIVFEGTSDQAKIKKTFIVYKDIHQVDLKLSIDPKDGASVQARIFYPAPIMPALKAQNQTAADVMYGDDTFKKIYLDSVTQDTFWVTPLLFGVENKYFMHSLVHDSNSFVQRAYYKLAGEKQLFAVIEGPAVEKKQEWVVSFYLGPKESQAMAAVDTKLERALDYSGFWAPISRVLLMILNWLFDYFHNYGWAIVVLTILMKLVLLPFTLRSERGMKQKADMSKRLKYIKQKYKDDPQARTQAEVEFMRKHGLGLGSCLPLLAQMPIFFGLQRVLSSSIEMYKASFLWMKDLSSPDPYYILPVLVMLGMLGSVGANADAKQRLPMIAAALAFGAFSVSFSAGLVLYIALSTLLNVVQTRAFKFFRLVG